MEKIKKLTDKIVWTQLNIGVSFILGVATTFAVYTTFSAYFSSKNMYEQTARQVAVDMVGFVDKALNEKSGIFHLFFSCNENQKNCVPFSPDSTPHMGYAIISLKKVGEIIGNDGYTKKADAILHTAIERCETEDTIYCEWNFFPLYEYYLATGDTVYKNSMTKLGEVLLEESTFKKMVEDNVPVKWWRLYEITNDEAYKIRLIALADEVLNKPIEDLTATTDLYTANGFKVDDMTIKTIWAVVIPAYKVSQDERYLSYAKDFFSQASVEHAVPEILAHQGGMGTAVKALESMIWISDLDPSISLDYRTKATKLAESVINESWDSPKRPIINGDYGLLSGSMIKATNIQGWFIVSLLSLGSETLKIRSL